MGTNRQRLFLIITALNAAMLVLNIFLFTSRKDPVVNQTVQYPYLSKRIFAEKQNYILIHFTPLRDVLQEYVDMQDGKGEIGLYFEFLPSGSSISINDQMQVKIASLVKIPVVMSVYSKVEKGKLSLDKQLTVQQKDLDPGFGDLWKKGVGTRLSVGEAINLTLQKSDNTAHKVLRDQLSEADITSVLQDLNVPLEQDSQQFIISPRNYTSILRSLYLSSYLTRKDSNHILQLLTKTDFNDKIAAGVPNDVLVAHKIGVFNLGDISQEVYSDCGIVYVPNRPYSLCVMVRNSTEDTARQHMKSISSLIYGYVTSAK